MENYTPDYPITDAIVAPPSPQGELEYALDGEDGIKVVRCILVGDNGVVEIPSIHEGKPVTGIGASAFLGCTDLTAILIPDSVTTIEESAFASCWSLRSVVLPNGLTTIGDYAFVYGGLESIIIPDSVTTVGSYAFCKCISLSTVTIGNGVARIGASAFFRCDKLDSVMFKNTSKWRTNNIPLSPADLFDSSTAADYLRHNYKNSPWTRE